MSRHKDTALPVSELPAGVQQVLTCAAEALLSTKSGARFADQGVTAQSLLANAPNVVLEALTAAPKLRAEVASRCPDLDSEAAALIDPDPQVVAEGLNALLHSGGEVRETKPRPKAEQKAAVHQQRRASRHAEKLALAQSRLAGAQRDLATARARISALTEERDDAQSNADTLATEVETLRAKAKTTTGVASALLGLLAPSPEQAPVQDPRAVELGIAPVTSTAPNAGAIAVRRAAESAELDVAAIETFARALLSPPRRSPVTTAATAVRVTPLGGGEEIGGSCILIEAAETRILVDAGLRTGKTKTADMVPPGIASALSGRLDAVVITHAHADHCGYVPRLAADVPGLPIFTSAGTASLLPTMWEDGLRVNQGRVAQQRSYGFEDEELYDTAAVSDAVHAVEPLPYGAVRDVGDLTIELFPAGHVLGAAGVVVSAGPTRVVVTGDISTTGQESCGVAQIPDSARGAQLLLIETTYCYGAHRSRDLQVKDLVGHVRAVTDAGGRVLIPAFALGRAQEVALILRSETPDLDVLVDGMASRICRTYADAAPPEGRSVIGANVRAVRGDRTTEIAGLRKGVVITTSGMLSGGPAIRWAREILPDPRSALLLTGYQDEESPGHRLLEATKRGGQFDLEGTPVTIEAQVEKYSLSAHADRPGLLDIIDQVDPDEVMLVHGMRGKQRDFAAVLQARGRDVAPTQAWQSR